MGISVLGVVVGGGDDVSGDAILKTKVNIVSTFFGKLLNKNPAYGRHQLSRPMRIVGPIQI